MMPLIKMNLFMNHLQILQLMIMKVCHLSSHLWHLTVICHLKQLKKTPTVLTLLQVTIPLRRHWSLLPMQLDPSCWSQLDKLVATAF